MKKLKKFLIPLLLCSIICFSFIPQTYAATNFDTALFSGTLHEGTSPYNTIASYNETNTVVAGYNQFFNFETLFLKSNYLKTCDSAVHYYRIDYMLYGGHNTSKTNAEWVKFAKLIGATRFSGVPNTTEVLGSIVNVTGWDRINVSTFIKYSWAPPADCVETYFDLTLQFNDSASDLFFYFPNANSNYYGVYDSMYELTNEQTAIQLINDYYETGSITQQKLDSIDQKLVDTNNKLDSINQSITQTNEKLASINDNISGTNNKLDNVNSNLNNVNSNIKDTQDYLKDDTAPSADINVLGNVQGILPEGPIDSLLNIPFKVLSILNSSFGGVCVPISGKFVFDSTLTIPCFSELFYNNVPDGIMVFINVVPSAFILIAYLKNLYKRVDRALSLETSADDEWGGI